MLNWFQQNEPGFYRKIRAQLNRGLGEDEIQVDWLDRVFSTVEAAVPVYFAAQERKDLMDLQLEMARQGRPPVDVRDYQTPIPIRHEIALPSGAQISPQTKTMLTIGLVGLAGLMAFKIVSPKK